MSADLWYRDHGKWSVKPYYVRWNGSAKYPGTHLLVRTRAGKLVKGIITSRPVHFMTDKEKKRPIRYP